MTLRSRWRHFQQRLFFQWQYIGSPPWDTGISPPELCEFIQSHKAGHALDLGCGTGTNVITLAKAGWEVIGVDYIASAITAGRQKARKAKVKVDLQQGDVTRLENIKGTFDLILDIGCYHSLETGDKIMYIQQLIQLLAQDGTFLLYGFICSEDDDERGIKPGDIALMNRTLDCIEQRDGEDRRGRSSAWFTYRLRV